MKAHTLFSYEDHCVPPFVDSGALLASSEKVRESAIPSDASCSGIAAIKLCTAARLGKLNDCNCHKSSRLFVPVAVLSVPD